MKASIERDFDTFAEVLHSITGITVDDLRSRNMRYPLVYYRGMVAEQLRQRGHTYIAIGKVFGRNHATILYEINNIRCLRLPSFSAIQEEYEAFKRKCKEMREEAL